MNINTSVKNGREKFKKNATISELITAECASFFYYIFLVHISQVGKSIIPHFYVRVSVHHKSILYKEPTRCNFGSIVY